MQETLQNILAADGKKNSLGRVNEVISIVLKDSSQLEELYGCLFNDNAWVRMRAADALEKVCREHPEWLLPFIDRLQDELATSSQASIQWHLAQIYAQVELNVNQKRLAVKWLTELLSSKDIDWIVSANVMDTLAQFAQDGFVSKSDVRALINIQQRHKSNAVVKRANKILGSL